jgi:hypothetical protein
MKSNTNDLVCQGESVYSDKINIYSTPSAVKNRERSRQYYYDHLEEVKAKNKIYRTKNLSNRKACLEVLNAKYLSAWTKYFKSIYGNQPICEVCGKKLLWSVDNPNIKSKDRICFDHRYNQTPINCIPAIWYRSRPCIDKYQKIWVQCHFGLLCGQCNVCLPTKNRKTWLENINRYVGKTNETM